MKASEILIVLNLFIFSPINSINIINGTKWPEAHVFYRRPFFGFSEKMENFFRAVAEYHSKTCVRFLPGRLGKDVYVTLVRGGVYGDSARATTCMQDGYNLLQWPRLSWPYMNIVSTLIHELGHILCLDHEHERHDRNNYLKTNECYYYWGGRAHPNATRGFYDYASQMHYMCGDKCGESGASFNDNKLCGQEITKGLSLLDADSINELYECGGCFRHRWVTYESFNDVEDYRSSYKIRPCRAMVGNELVVGTFEPFDMHCYVAFNGSAISVDKNGFEVLTIPGGFKAEDSEYYWVKVSNSLSGDALDALLANAIPGGRVLWKIQTKRRTGYVGYTRTPYKYNDKKRKGLVGTVWSFDGKPKVSFPMQLTGKDNSNIGSVKILACRSKMPDTLPDYSAIKLRDLYKNWRLRYMTKREQKIRTYKNITIEGRTVPEAAEIYIDLTEQSAAGPILLHLRFLLNQNSSLTANSLKRSGWTKEKQTALEDKHRFTAGNNYTIQILYRTPAFEIYVNRFHVSSYKMLLETSVYIFLRIHGDTTITQIDYGLPYYNIWF